MVKDMGPTARPSGPDPSTTQRPAVLDACSVADPTGCSTPGFPVLHWA